MWSKVNGWLSEYDKKSEDLFNHVDQYIPNSNIPKDMITSQDTSDGGSEMMQPDKFGLFETDKENTS